MGSHVGNSKSLKAPKLYKENPNAVKLRDLRNGFAVAEGDDKEDVKFDPSGKEDVKNKSIVVKDASDNALNGTLEKLSIDHEDKPQWRKPNTDIWLRCEAGKWILSGPSGTSYSPENQGHYKCWPPTCLWKGAHDRKCTVGNRDRRKLVTSTRYEDHHKCILHLRFQRGHPGAEDRYSGTAFVAKIRLQGAAERTVLLTAAHCLVKQSEEGAKYESKNLVADNGKAGGPSLSLQTYKYHPKYLEHQRAFHGFDIGVITLSEAEQEQLWTIVGRENYLVVQDHSSENMMGKAVTVSGFPGDKVWCSAQDSNNNESSQWECTGIVKNDTSSEVSSSFGLIKYDLDTHGGQSGSPVIATSSAGNKRLVVGVHVSAGDDNSNLGTRLTKSMLAWLKSTIQQN